MKHIAILRQPFFDMVLSGEKTIESRWSMNKVAPYNKINIFERDRKGGECCCKGG